LGFHAPYLDVPPGQYDEGTVLAAFGKAMEVVTELTAWSERLSLSDDFLVSLFSTGRDDMYMIDTVGKAAQLSIHLVGHVLPQELTEPMIREACRQASTYFGADWDRIDGSVSIQNAFRILPNQSGTQRGVAVAEYGIESWSGWYVCAVGYNPPRGTVPAPAGHELASMDGRRNFLYVQVSDDPIQQWNDPMSFAPDPSLAAIMQAAEPLSEVFTNAILSETVFPADTPIRRMRTPDWIQDPPATLVRAGGYAAPTYNPPAIQFILDYNSFWDHNGSRMGLVAQGTQRQFHYVVPRTALAERGVTPGTLLFEGERIGNRYAGTARIFATPQCGVFTYNVEGPISADQRSVTMFGRAPRVNSRCEVIGYRDDRLVFTLE
jgi:hypothetical protein